MRKEYDFSKGKRGAVIASSGKTRITIMLDDDVIEHFRARAEADGTGYQTMINAVLRASIKEGKPADDRPLTARVLRQVLREELDPRKSVKPRRAMVAKSASAA
ncbi:MAG: BrnA antitoxin family protein [Burkholderiales bacterium]|nr:BrnA antitoxin family protein [Burkholderiales bacterium]ODU70854.1 MAG: CopG family transcriptional regulator [Lautropia sp. SCN 66-9]